MYMSAGRENETFINKFFDLNIACAQFACPLCSDRAVVESFHHKLLSGRCALDCLGAIRYPQRIMRSPRVTEMLVIPVAGQDSMLLNLSGAHGPLFTRNIIILKDDAGHTGLGEVPGGEKI